MSGPAMLGFDAGLDAGDAADWDAAGGADTGSVVAFDGTVESPGVPEPVGDVAFRGAMRLLATGVVMVTTRVDGRAWGMTVSACMSLSAEPPRLLLSVREMTVTARAVRTNGAFGISILSAAHRDVADMGAAPGRPKYVDSVSFQPPRHAGRHRMPRVAGALCHVDCVVEDVHPVGDHLLFVGLVVHTDECETHAGKGPLIYWDRNYRAVTSGGTA